MEARRQVFGAMVCLMIGVVGCDSRPALDGSWADAAMQGQVVLSERKIDDGAGGTDELATVSFGVAATAGSFRFVFESADVLLEAPTMVLAAPYGGWLSVGKRDNSDARSPWRVSGTVEVPNTEPYDAERTKAWLTVDGEATVEVRGETLAIGSTATVYRELSFATESQQRAPYVESGTFVFTVTAHREAN